MLKYPHNDITFQIPLEVLKNLSNDKHMYKIILENYPNLLSSKSHSDTGPDQLAAEASMVNTRVPVKYSMKGRLLFAKSFSGLQIFI